MNSTLLDQARLVNAGWEQSMSGRWSHHAFHNGQTRRKLFSFEAALALLDASESVAAVDTVVG